MNRVLTAAALLLLLAAPALAGPNAGGVLVVHDTGYLYCNDQSEYPTPPPASCQDVDNELPLGPPPAPQVGWIWKVYAAFPEMGSPRLKAFAMASAFPTQVVVLTGGLPDPVADFEISQGGWPTTSGGGVGISFGQTKTTTIVECYWFGGYAYEQPGLWQLTPHPTQPMHFVDDSIPPVEDPIAGLGSLGFGQPGETICTGPPLGACCVGDGSCQLMSEGACAAICGFWIGFDISCDPNPCPLSGGHGACCRPDGTCQISWQVACVETGGSFVGGCCEPNPCSPLGACCDLPMHCIFVTEAGCAAVCGYWVEGLPCEPIPCPYGHGACCHADGTCSVAFSAECEQAGGVFYGGCCDPNPCTGAGACCVGADCVVLPETACLAQGGVFIGGECLPGTCPTPVQETTWGRVKQTYR